MKKLIFTFLTMIMLLLPVTGMAQVQLPDELRPPNAAYIPVSSGNPATAGNIILQLIAGSLIYVAGPIAVFMIALGGFMYVISHGDQTKMEQAKKTLIWAITGLLVIIVSYAIVINIFRIIVAPVP